MKYESNNFQFEAEMLWESAGEGIVRQIMGYNANLMMVKVKFETGAIGFLLIINYYYKYELPATFVVQMGFLPFIRNPPASD